MPLLSIAKQFDVMFHFMRDSIMKECQVEDIVKYIPMKRYIYNRTCLKGRKLRFKNFSGCFLFDILVLTEK